MEVLPTDPDDSNGVNTEPSDHPTQQDLTNPTADTRSQSARGGNQYGDAHVHGGRNIFGNVHINNHYGSWARDERVQSPRGVNRVHSFHQAAPLFFVPRSSAAYFTGRQRQLESLNSCLNSASEPTQKIVVIEGLGGSGKTQLCLRFAELNRLRYEGIFWIDASTRRSADDGYAELGMLFGKGAASRVGKYWLTQAARPWLLILDNADAMDLDIAELLPAGPHGHIIVTTRNRNIAECATAGVLRLTRMDPEEAVDLLLNSAYPRDSPSRTQAQSRALASTIVENLGYLAIAIRQAGSAIRKNIYTLEKYLSTYLGRRSRLLPHIESLARSSGAEDAETITTWEIPFNQLQAEGSSTHEDAVALLHVLACLHHVSVPLALLAKPAEQQSCLKSPEHLPEIFSFRADDVEDTQARMRLALNLLHDYSIIEFDATTEACSIHPVVHDWIRYKIKYQGLIEQALRYSSYVLAVQDLEVQKSSSYTPAYALVRHVDSLLSLLDAVHPELLATTDGCDQLAQFATVFENAGQWRRSLEVLDIVVRVRVAKYGGHNAKSLQAKRQASLCHWNLFEVADAIKLQEGIWKATWKHRPSYRDWLYPIRPVHAEYLSALSDLTQTLWLAGRRDLSKRAGERALGGLSKLFGRDDQRTVDAMFHLGRTYRHLGLLSEAQDLLAQVLHWRKKNLGFHHIDTLMVRNEIGMTFYNQKRHLRIAERMVRNVLKDRQDILGDEHAYTLWSVNDLSKVLIAQGRPSEAAEMLEEIISAVVRTLGAEHVGMQMTKGNLARAYALCRSWSRSESTLAELIPIVSEDHPDRIHCMIGYTRVLIRQQKYDQAETACAELERVISQKAHQQLKKEKWNMVMGLKAQIYQDLDKQAALMHLKRNFPQLIENVMDEEFELT